MIDSKLVDALIPYAQPRAGPGQGSRFLLRIIAYVKIYNQLDSEAVLRLNVFKAAAQVASPFSPFSFMLNVEPEKNRVARLGAKQASVTPTPFSKPVVDIAQQASEALRARLLDLIMMSIAAFAISRGFKANQGGPRWKSILDIGEAAHAESGKTGLLLMSRAKGEGAKAANELSARWLESALESPWTSADATTVYDTWLQGPSDGQTFQQYLATVAKDWKSLTMLVEAAPPDIKSELTSDSMEVKRAEGGLWRNAAGDVVETTNWEPHGRPLIENLNWGIFAANWSGTIYLGQDLDGWHHSSFLAGRPVLAAGLMRFKGGVLRAITAESGHYLPKVVNLLQLVTRNHDISDDTLIMPFHPDDISDDLAAAWNAKKVAPTHPDIGDFFYRVGDFRRHGLAIDKRLDLVVNEKDFKRLVT